jgi:hypothetical protein
MPDGKFHRAAVALIKSAGPGVLRREIIAAVSRSI